jgi:uncharacterized protein YndB with AHSA1/START domain
MRRQVEITATVNRPIEEVFSHWADGRLLNEWNPAAFRKDVAQVGQGPISAGTKFRGTFKGLGEIVYEIVEYQFPTLRTTAFETKFGRLRHTIQCEQVPGGTRFVSVGEAELKGIFPLLAPILRSAFRKSFKQEADALKHYLEAKSDRTKA